MVLPRRNEGDLEELPEELRREMTFIVVDSVDEVLDLVLAKAPAKNGRVRNQARVHGARSRVPGPGTKR
jgi:ATP-dependent Lon protease